MSYQKIFLWISIKVIELQRSISGWTPCWLNTGPPVSPTGTDAPVWVVRNANWLESVFVHYKAGLGTQVSKGLTTYLGPRAHPNPPTFGLKAMWGVNALPSQGVTPGILVAEPSPSLTRQNNQRPHKFKTTSKDIFNYIQSRRTK